MEERKCGDCHQTKPLEDFYPDRQRGHQRRCKACSSSRNKAYYQKHYKDQQPERWRTRVKAGIKDDVLRRIYGPLKKPYDEMLKDQGGVCAICKRPPDTKRLCVDHEHDTNKIRELLCTLCNVGLGNFRENPEFLTAAIAYLAKHKS